MNSSLFQNPQAKASRDQALLLLLCLALLARLPIWLGSYGAAFDLESYRRVAEALSQGRPLYGDPALDGRYPYLPAWALLLCGLRFFSYLSGLAPELCFKLPALLGDLSVTALLFFIMERLTFSAQAPDAGPAWTQRPFWTALAYAVNPLSLLIGAGHGQFDSLVLFFILLAAWYFEFSQSPKADAWSALSLGAAIALKTWPIFLLPLFYKNLSRDGERRRFLGLSLLPPLGLGLIFLFQSGLEPMLRAMAYSGSQALSLPEALHACFYGAGAAEESYRAVAALLRACGAAGLALCFSAYALSKWRFPLLPGLALGVLSLYVFAGGLATQYLLWLLPFALLLPGRLALLHTGLGLALLLIFYSLLMPGVFLGAQTWAPAQLPAWSYLIWAALNLGLWIFFVTQWSRLLRLCRRPKGRLEFN